MCKNGSWCQFPEKLKGKPGECSPKQKFECHGESIACEPKKQDAAGKKFHADGSVCTCGEKEEKNKLEK